MSKYTFLILTIFNCELSWSRPHFKDEVIQYESRQDPGPGGYTFRFESTKGMKKKEAGIHPETDGLRVHGFYGYRSPSGLEHLTYYKADENGFRAQENHKMIPQNMNFHDQDQVDMPISQIITSLPWYSNILKLEEYKTRSTTDYNFQEHILNNRDVEEEIITITTTNPMTSSTSEEIKYDTPTSLVTEARINKEGPSTVSPINEDLHATNPNESVSDPAVSSLTRIHPVSKITNNNAIGEMASIGENGHSGDNSLHHEKSDLGKSTINPTRKSLKTQNVSIPSLSHIVASTTLPENSVMFESTSTQNTDTPHSLDPSSTTAPPGKFVQIKSNITPSLKFPVENVGAIISTTISPSESLAKSTLPEKILRLSTSTTIIPSEYSGMTTSTSEATILSSDLLTSTKRGENTSAPKSNKILTTTTGSSDPALTTPIATIISENQKPESDQNSDSKDQLETEVINFTTQNQDNSTSTLIPPDSIANNYEISSAAIASLAGG